MRVLTKQGADNTFAGCEFGLVVGTIVGRVPQLACRENADEPSCRRVVKERVIFRRVGEAGGDVIRYARHDLGL